MTGELPMPMPVPVDPVADFGPYHVGWLIAPKPTAAAKRVPVFMDPWTGGLTLTRPVVPA